MVPKTFLGQQSTTDMIWLKQMPLTSSETASHSTLPSVAISHALDWPWAKHLLNRPFGQYYSVYIYNVYKEISQNLILRLNGLDFSVLNL